MKNTHIEQRLAARAEKIRSSHAAQWMGGDAEDLVRKVQDGSLEYIERLRKVQRGIGSFVKIVTGKEIPVIYSSGQQSYTDGKNVVLSADIDPAKLDAMCGTALHEATHCHISNESLAFLPLMMKQFDSMVSGSKLEQEGLRLGLTKPQMLEHVKMVMNVLEDRRIDLWQYQNAPGYRPYYKAMYDEYWHSEKIDNALQDPNYRDTAVDNYMMFIINMTNEHWDGKALPQLTDIRRIANLSEKGLLARGDSDKGWRIWKSAMAGANGPDLDRFPLLFRDAIRIVEVAYANSTMVKNPNKPQQQPDNGEGEDDSDLPNMDSGSMSEDSDDEKETDGKSEKDGKPGKSKKYRPVSQKDVDEAMARQKKFLEHQLDKKQIDQASKDQIDQLDKTKAQIVDVEGEFLPRNVKARVIIYRDVTKATLENPHFPFAHRGGYGYGRNAGSSVRKNSYMEEALKTGIRMGQVLAHKIRVMTDEKPLTFNRQEKGRLDKRRVSALGYGAEDVFSITLIEKRKPANIWLDVDFSGSMSGEKSQQAMAVAVAIAYAADKSRALNATISIRDGGYQSANVAILYDSRRHKFTHLRSIVPYLEVGGGTPESLCFEAIKAEMMKMYQNERKYFVNFSDGEPGHSFHWSGRSYMYGGPSAQKHCRMLMRDFRDSGINVLSYYIGGGSRYEHPGFKAMYGEDARFIDPNSIGSVATTLNRLLLS